MSGGLRAGAFSLGGLLLAGLIFGSACGAGGDDHRIYEPLALADWEVSTPRAEGLDPDLVLTTYQKARDVSTLYSLLVVKNGRLVAEKYFHDMDHRDSNPTASVTKSIISALVGIALRDQILTGLDQTITGFFPEIAWQDIDPRKSQITIRQMAQMRSGFPWEEFSGHLDQLFSSPNWIPLIEDFPLSADPGAQFGYSNLTAHLLAIMLARAANTDLRTFAQTRLFDLMDIEIGDWPRDASGYYYGSGDLSLTPREMAKFGALCLNGGEYDGGQLVPADWVSASLTPASFDTYGAVIPTPPYGKILTHFGLLDYGNLWWSSTAGGHPVKFAWGHGGQLIVLVHDLDMIVVTSADHLAGQFGAAAWQKEKAVMELVGEFIASIGT